MKMNKQEQETHKLLSLLKETHEQMMMMTKWCERLQPVKLSQEMEIDMETGTYPPITVDLTEEDLKWEETRLFRLLDPEFEQNKIFDDQTSRSILKDVRGYIRHYNDVLDIDCEVYK